MEKLSLIEERTLEELAEKLILGLRDVGDTSNLKEPVMEFQGIAEGNLDVIEWVLKKMRRMMQEIIFIECTNHAGFSIKRYSVPGIPKPVVVIDDCNFLHVYIGGSKWVSHKVEDAEKREEETIDWELLDALQQAISNMASEGVLQNLWGDLKTKGY